MFDSFTIGSFDQTNLAPLRITCLNKQRWTGIKFSDCLCLPFQDFGFKLGMQNDLINNPAFATSVGFNTSEGFRKSTRFNIFPRSVTSVSLDLIYA